MGQRSDADAIVGVGLRQPGSAAFCYACHHHDNGANDHHGTNININDDNTASDRVDSLNNFFDVYDFANDHHDFSNNYNNGLARQLH